MKSLLTAAALLALTAPAFADGEITGDVKAGSKDWKKCKACHLIADPAGEVLEKGGKTGPNLWGVVGRAAGGDEGYKRYSDKIVELGEGGLVWTPEELAAYIPNAKKYLGAKSAMTPQKLKDVNNVIAFLAQYGPAE